VEVYRSKSGIYCGADSQLQFAVNGLFATCPDCGKPNALRVFCSLVDAFRKRLSLFDSSEGRGATP